MKQKYFTQLTIRNICMFMNTWSRSTSHNSQSGTRQVCLWTHEAEVLHITHNQEHVRYIHEHMKQEYYTQLTIRNICMFMNTWSGSTSHNSQSGTRQVCSWTHEAEVLHTTHNQEHVRYVHEHMKQEYFTQLTIRNTSGMFMNTWSTHNSQSGTHQYVHEHMKQEYYTQLTIRNTSGMFMNTWSRSTSHNSQSGTYVCSRTHEAGVLHTTHNQSGMFMNTWSRSTSHNSQSGTRQVCSWTHEAEVLHTTHNQEGMFMFMNTWSRSTTHNSQSGTRQVCSWTHDAGVNQEHIRYVHEHMKQEYYTQLTIRNTSGMFMNTSSRNNSHNSQPGTHQVCSYRSHKT